MTDLTNLTRVEIVDETGRVYSTGHPHDPDYQPRLIVCDLQDDGRTLKVFVGRGEGAWATLGNPNLHGMDHDTWLAEVRAQVKPQPRPARSSPEVRDTALRDVLAADMCPHEGVGKFCLDCGWAADNILPTVRAQLAQAWDEGLLEGYGHSYSQAPVVNPYRTEVPR